MSRILTYLLLGVMVAHTAELYQFLKIPALFAHFEDHQERGQQINFISFLAMHYWGEDLDDDDDDMDMQLPFKKVETAGSHGLFPPCNKALDISQCFEYIVRDYPEPYQLGFYDTLITDLFKPPRHHSLHIS